MIELTLAGLFVIAVYVFAYKVGVRRFEFMDTVLISFGSKHKEHLVWAKQNFAAKREIWACVFVGLYIMSPLAFLSSGPIDQFVRYYDGKPEI